MKENVVLFVVCSIFLSSTCLSLFLVFGGSLVINLPRNTVDFCIYSIVVLWGTLVSLYGKDGKKLFIYRRHSFNNRLNVAGMPQQRK